MIRWREEKDCYRARIFKYEEAAILFAGSIIPTLVTLSQVLRLVQDKWLGPAEIVVAGAIAVGFGSIALAGLFGMLRCARGEAWIEIPLAGRVARWKDWGASPQEAPIQVTRFEVAEPRFGTFFPGFRYSLRALLPDGRQVPVCAGCEWHWEGRARRLVEQLNELLGAPSEP